MAANSRFGVREIVNVTLRSLTTGKPILYLDSLKVSNLDTTANRVYARGVI